MACAGHEDPLLLSADGKATRVRLEAVRPLRGRFRLSAGDADAEAPARRWCSITDGVTEAQNARRDLVREQTAARRCALKAGSATAICEAIRDHVRNFEEGTEATDDLTVMAVRYLGAA